MHSGAATAQVAPVCPQTAWGGVRCTLPRHTFFLFCAGGNVKTVMSLALAWKKSFMQVSLVTKSLIMASPSSVAKSLAKFSTLPPFSRGQTRSAILR